MPRIITTAQSIAYLRALAETGNATLAAEQAGVSREWAYKKRAVDAWFAARFREFTALARERLRAAPLASPPLPNPSPPQTFHPPCGMDGALKSAPPAEGGGATGAEGGGAGKRRVNRDRAGGWTAAKEARFIDALAATRDVPLAAFQVGISAPCAYGHRMRRPGFAARWREALADDEAFAEAQWVATLICLLEGWPVPADYPVQTIGIGDVIRLYERSCGVRRGRPMQPDIYPR